MTLDIKLILVIISTIIMLTAYYPYIRDILQKKTKPHAYTWLIWAITQGTATFALLHGGGGYAVINLAAGTLLVIFVFFLSLKYGTKNITKSDTIVLIAALFTIIVWWLLDNPLLALLMAAAIDALGYIPTYRKTFSDPWSETPIFWLAMVISGILAIIANSEYNLLTVTYLATITVASALLFILIIGRKLSLSQRK